MMRKRWKRERNKETEGKRHGRGRERREVGGKARRGERGGEGIPHPQLPI